MTASPRTSPPSVRAARAVAQLLVEPRRATSPVDVVRRLCAVQAQDSGPAALAIRARSADAVAADVERARADGALVRTWAMRGTLQLMTREDVGWILALYAPAAIPRAVRRLTQLGVDAGTADRAVGMIDESVREGEIARRDLVARLRGRGIPAEGQAGFHLVRLAALRGRLVVAGERGGDALLAPLRASRIDAPRDDLLARLAARYRRGYGPAAPEDFAAWAGIGLGEARRAFADAAPPPTEPAVDGAAPPVRLLPAWDAFLLGYRDRSFALDARHRPLVNRGGGIVRPVVVASGRVVGTWRTARRAAAVDIVVEPFARPRGGLVDALEADVGDVGRFLGLSTRLVLDRPPPGARRA